MKNFIEKIYRRLPDGYYKSILKNIISYSVYILSFQREKIVIDNTKFYLYRDRIFDNKILQEEIKGYNQKYTLHKGDIVIDAGAYTGFFSIYASQKVGPKGMVIAFEPDPYNYKRLRRNISINNIHNIKVIKKGLYKKDTTLSFDIQGISSKIDMEGQYNQKSINKIPVVSLDNELKRLNISQVDFVKMDIEGAEIEAIKGCKNIIKKSKNIHFAIASYHIVDETQTRHYLERYFKDLGMKTITGYKRHLTTYAMR